MFFSFSMLRGNFNSLYLIDYNDYFTESRIGMDIREYIEPTHVVLPVVNNEREIPCVILFCVMHNYVKLISLPC